jgi:hypothetical protein
MGLIHSPRIVTDGLVLCLDAANSRSYPGTGTTWTDLKGTHDGTLTNGAAFSSDNRGCITCDGTNDHVVLGGTGAGTAIASSQELTVMYWIRFASVSKQDALEFGSSNNEVLRLGLDSDNTLSFQTRGGGRQHTVGTSQTISANQWYHFTGSWKASTTPIIYIDGEIVATSNTTCAGCPVTSISNFDSLNKYIGLHVGGPGHYLNGDITCINLYSRQLSADEILQNYNATRGRFE